MLCLVSWLVWLYISDREQLLVMELLEDMVLLEDSIMDSIEDSIVTQYCGRTRGWWGDK